MPKHDKKAQANEAYTLNIQLESPPLVSYGPPDDSSGALMSGVLHLTPRQVTVKNESFEVDKLEMKLIMDVTTHKPIGHNCPACATRSKVLNTWIFILSHRVLQYNGGAAHGEHSLLRGTSNVGGSNEVGKAKHLVVGRRLRLKHIKSRPGEPAFEKGAL